MIDSSSPEDFSAFGDSPGESLRPSVDLAIRAPEENPPNACVPETLRVTKALDGTGGRLKDDPEDFVVEEVPLYEPSGKGEHLYLRVRKRDLSHEKLVEHLGRSLNVSRHDVGTAGMKDRRAVTTQWVSVPARCEERLGLVENEQVHVLDASKHTNALKTGHCKGNRFSIRVRDVVDDASQRAAVVADALAEFGCPNYYGSQRFGVNGSTLVTGYELLTGIIKQAEIPKGRRKFLVRLGLSALQSAIFNDVLASRVADGSYKTVLLGDVMTFPGSRSVFEVLDAEVEQRRMVAGEILITGPMVGVKMRGPTGVPEEIETAALTARGLRIGQFAAWRSVAPGGRRPLLVRPDFHSIEQSDGTLTVDMTLPTGSFATVVLDEIMKS